MTKKFQRIPLLLLVAFLFIIPSTIFSQIASNGIFFQAIARDQFANPAKDRKIYVHSSIIQSTATGTKVLIEEHQTTTDGSGVFSISVGQGTRTGGTVIKLDNVEWARGPYYLNLKISIAPLAPVANWDYTKDWIDLGTSPFGTVPYAFYSGSSGALDTKLNITDTVKMLAIYAKAVNVNELANQVKTKLSVEDTTTMLAPYAKMVNELIAINNTSLTVESINATLDGKVNLADSINQYVTPTQLNAKTFDSTAIYNQLNRKLNVEDSLTKYVTPNQLDSKTFDSTSIYIQIGLKASNASVTSSLATKENIDNKSSDIITDANSFTKFPTVKAIKDYVDSEISSIAAPILDANTSTKGKIQLAGDLAGTAASPEIAVDAITTAKLKDANVTDAKILSISGSKVTGNIEGNAATASKIATPVTINGVLFDGSTDITIAIQNGTNTNTDNFVKTSTDQTINDTKQFTKDMYINNIRAGRGAIDYIGNTVFGYAGLGNNSGVGNTAFGFQGLMSNTSGSANTSMGFAALIENTTGGGNTAIGYQALQKNTGNNNTVIGTNAMYLSQNSSNNIVVGNSAMDWSTNGAIGNTVIGIESMRFATSASENIVVGGAAGTNIINEVKNTLIGNATNINSAGISNSSALGYGATVNASNQIQIGNSQITEVNTSGTIITSADINAKHIKGNSGALSIAAFSGAGTTPSAISVTGTDMSGVVTLTTGSSPSVNAVLATITYNTSFSTAPVVVITPANAATASLTSAQEVWINIGATNFSINTNTTAVNAATIYKWNYVVIQ